MIFSIGPEALITSLGLLIAILYPQFGLAWFGKAEQLLSALAKRRKLSVLLCGLFALALRAVLLPILPYPIPSIHDEFSHLLAADTFSHWRLTNPTPPLWIHFETLHVILTPTYASMYPPLQGLFLAAGKILMGHPFWGVWLSVGLMCSSLCWMLQGWIPPLWALIGGMLPVLRFGVFGWAVSYWGGAAAAIGGALVMGALPRVIRHQRVPDALLMALGLAMLANSRPYEGLLFSLPVLARLLFWMFREKRPSSTVIFRQVALPIGLLLLTFAVMMGYYFWRVTGSPFRMPYQVNRDMYSMARYFYWQQPHAVAVYHHDEMWRFYVNEFQRYQKHRSLVGFFWETGFKLGLGWLFFIGPALTIPLFAVPWVLRDRRIRTLVVTAVVGVAGMELVIYFAPHYAAPFTCIVIAVIVQGLRHLRAWRWDGRPVGAFLAHVTVAICILMLPVQGFVLWARERSPNWQPEGIERQKMLDYLGLLPGDHLVLVHYNPDHDVLSEEWVYNSADIIHAKVVWAREMDGTDDKELMNYFKNRSVWLVQADEKPPKLSFLRRPLPASPESGNQE